MVVRDLCVRIHDDDDNNGDCECIEMYTERITFAHTSNTQHFRVTSNVLSCTKYWTGPLLIISWVDSSYVHCTCFGVCLCVATQICILATHLQHLSHRSKEKDLKKRWTAIGASHFLRFVSYYAQFCGEILKIFFVKETRMYEKSAKEDAHVWNECERCACHFTFKLSWWTIYLKWNEIDSQSSVNRLSRTVA